MKRNKEMLASSPQRERTLFSRYNLSVRISIDKTIPIHTWRVGHGHQEVVAGGGGPLEPRQGRAGPGGGSVEGGGAGGGAGPVAGGGGHAVTDAAQTGAEAQHQAGTQRGAARLKYNKN